MKHYILTLLLGLCLSLPLMAQSKKAPSDAGAKWLREAYRQHLYEERDLREHMSPGLRLKIERMRHMLNCDPITNTQDPNPELFSRLTVQPLAQKGYYSIIINSGIVSQITVHLEGKQIKSLTPWLALPQDMEQKFPEGEVDKEAPRRFVMTFMHQYLNTYIRASEHIEQELDSLRRRYLTPKAQKEWERVAKYVEEQDGRPGFDQLIDDYDYDATFVSNGLEIGRRSPLEIEVQYRGDHDLHHAIYFVLVRTEEGYLIDDFGNVLFSL